jgi:archaemetzincin
MFILFISCEHDTGAKIFLQHRSLKDVYQKLETIHIIPMGGVSINVLNQVKSALENFYQRPVKIISPIKVSGNLRRTPWSRYSADSILKYYRQRFQAIVVTSHDITIYDTAKKADWGIFGWGKIPGKICVISAYPARIGKDVSEKVLLSRIRKVAIHEVGHNLGLNHCTKDITCVMHAADKKASQVDKEKELFCENCKRELLKL